MENGILIEILNSLHKLLGLPVIQGTIDPQHLDCIQKCSEVTHFYKTECLAKCGINPLHINTILEANSVLDAYTSSATQQIIENEQKNIPNSTNHENLDNTNKIIPRVTELFHNLTKTHENDVKISQNLTELHREIIRRLFDAGGGGVGEEGAPGIQQTGLETVDVKYLYLFAFMALTPVLVLFYCCYKQFTKPLTTAYSDSNNHSTRHPHYHRHRRRIYLGQMPPRENITISQKNNSSTLSNSSQPNAIINESRIRTVSLPAYEDCVKSSLSDLEDNTYSNDSGRLEGKSRLVKKAGKKGSSGDSKDSGSMLAQLDFVGQLESNGKTDVLRYT